MIANVYNIAACREVVKYSKYFIKVSQLRSIILKIEKKLLFILI